MKNRSTLFIAIALCSWSFVANAQKIECLNYDWGAPVYEEVSGAMYDTVSAYVLKSNELIEVAYQYNMTHIEEFRVYHEKIKINKSDALDRYNKIRLFSHASHEILELKARFIGKDGKVIELGKADIKTAAASKDNPSYKFLAIEGAEVGGIIEYYWVTKGGFSICGDIVIQEDIPRKQVTASIITPFHLKLLTKSYNRCPKMLETADLDKDKRTLFLSATDVPSLRREPYSSYEANLQKLEYTIAYNYKKGEERIFNLSSIATDTYTGISLEQSEQKSIKSLAKKISVADKAPEEEKIRQIENYVKVNFQPARERIQRKDLSKIPDILSTGYFNRMGSVRLMAGLFDYFEIPFELVLTCDKREKQFDEFFDGYNFFDDYLFYFPGLDKYLDPSSKTNRLGIINTCFLGNNGMFLRKTVVTKSVGIFVPYDKQIPANDYEKSCHNTVADIHLDLKGLTLDYTLEHTFTGYESHYQSYFYYADATQKQKFLDEMLLTDGENVLVDCKIENDKIEDWFMNPLKITAHLSGSKFISRAGENIAFNIGMLIGRQSELYREKERTLPIVYDNAKIYVRELKFQIPEGYEISNPDVLKMKTELKMDKQVQAYFYSDYKIMDNQLVISCSEAYKLVEFPVEKYSEFASVVNAAADFNKITLILKPKS